MLHGMGEPIKHAIRELGLRLREYAPVGELIPGMAYLVRRLLENTANDSFLRQTFVEGAAIEELIQAPATSPDFGAEPARLPVVEATDPADPAPFVNQPHADFSRKENRDAYDAALRAVRARLGAHYPLRVGGRAIETAKTLDLGQPGEAGRGDRHDRLRRSCRGRGRRRRGARGRCRHGATRRRASAPPCSSAPPSSCAARTSSSPRS